MALTSGQRRAFAVQESWASIDRFENRTELITHLQESGLGFRLTDMYKIIGNIWERAHAPMLDAEKFRFDHVPKELMAELVWDREEIYGIKGSAIYKDAFGNVERHTTVFWTSNYSEGLEYEQEWGSKVEFENRYPGLEYVGFEIDNVWHKKGADYGHPFELQEL